MTQVVVTSIAAMLTIAVLSRVFGENPLSRAAQYLFVGVSLGLAFVVAFHQVFMPAARALLSGEASAMLLYGIPLILGLMLLPRALGAQQASWLSNIPLAVVFGVGAALVVGGAIIGTLIPQISATAQPINTTNIAASLGTIVLVLTTIIILVRFYYTVPVTSGTGRIVAGASVLGHWLLMIAFGFFFAGTVQTYLSALTERLQFLFSLLPL